MKYPGHEKTSVYAESILPFPYCARYLCSLLNQIYFLPFITLLCSLGGWPLWVTAAQLPCPLASSWLQPLESTSKEIRAGGKKCHPLLGHGWQSLPLLYTPAVQLQLSPELLPGPLKLPTIAHHRGYSHHLFLDSLYFAYTFINRLFINYPYWVHYLDTNNTEFMFC